MRRLLLFALPLLVLGCQDSTPSVGRGEDGQLLLGREAATDVAERSVSLQGRTLVIDLYAGDVTVVGADVDEAELRFTRVARGVNAASAASRLEGVSVEEAGNEEIYQFVATSSTPSGTAVNVEARVPRGTDLNIAVEAGRIRVSGVGGPLDATAEAGSVRAAGLGVAPVRLRARAGAIEAGFAEAVASGTYAFESEAGGITVVLPAGSSAEVEAETETGTVAAQGLTFGRERLDDRLVGAAFSGRLGAGGARITARTNVGTVRFEAGTMASLEGVTVAPARGAARPQSDSVAVPRGAPVAPTPEL